MQPVARVAARVPDRVDHDAFLAARDTLLNNVVHDIRKTPQRVAPYSALIGCSRLWRILDGDDGCLHRGGKCLAQAPGAFAVVKAQPPGIR